MLQWSVWVMLCSVSAHGLSPSEIGAFYNGVTVTEESGVYTIEGSSIPDHETHDFPTNYNSNTITDQNYSIKISASPEYVEDVAGCLPMGTVGFAINGVALYNPYTATGFNAVDGDEREEFDDCQGHPDMNGVYHYHQISSCLHEYLFGNAVHEDKLFGIALDGFPIYVSHDGMQTDLDECNGKLVEGEYRYYATYSFPYLLGCFKGEVIDEDNGSPSDGQMPPPNGEMPPPNGDMPPPDGEMPPPNGDMPPPDGDMPPPDGEMPPLAPDGEMPPPDGGEGQTGGICYYANVEAPNGFTDLVAGTLNGMFISGSEYTASAPTLLLTLLLVAVQLIL